LPPRSELLELRREPFDSPASTALVQAMVDEVASRYGGQDAPGKAPEAEDFVDWLVGYLDGRPVACGGILPLDPGVAELKRLYVERDARGRGYARRVLAELERAAVAAGFTVLRLETGTEQPEAIALYASTGYRAVDCWGAYLDDPQSVCLEKLLG
jgi:ribosomal protein S18 acetylase RimI-like enzyme